MSHGPDSDRIGEIATRLAQRLSLRRPLVFLDLETTGTSPQSDRIVEIAALKLFPDGKFDLRSTRVNPGIPIPDGASAVHGISDNDVEDKPDFRQIAKSFRAFLEDADLGGFGIARFDLRVLEAEFRRAGLPFSIQDRAVVDAMSIFFAREPRDLAAAMRFYLGEELIGAHGAEADVIAAMDVLVAQFERYVDLPTELSDLDLIAAPTRREPDWVDSDGLLVRRGENLQLNFGKHKGSSLDDVLRSDPAYVDWMLKGEFSDELKRALSEYQRRTTI